MKKNNPSPGGLRAAQDIVEIIQDVFCVAGVIPPPTDGALRDMAIIIDYQTKAKELREILGQIVHLVSDGSCEQFHHEKKDQHKDGEPCPPAERVKVLRNKAISLLEQTK